jgi:hypothetical protein
MMKALGTPNVTAELKQKVINGVMRESAGRSVDQLAQEENRVLIGLLKLRSPTGLNKVAAAEPATGTAISTDRSVATNGDLTAVLADRLNHPATSPDFDLKKGANEVLADVGMTSADCGGELSFYGTDPILPSALRFGTMAAIGLAARSVAASALWRQATGEGQNISVDVRKALSSADSSKANGKPSMADHPPQVAMRSARS